MIQRNDYKAGPMPVSDLDKLIRWAIDHSRYDTLEKLYRLMSIIHGIEEADRVLARILVELEA